MGKLSNMMYMIDLLNTGNVYSIKELSEKLGVTERMIRYYKEEISKNPELILYYIFTDIGNSNCYTTSFHIKKNAREDEYNNAYNATNKNSTLYYNNIEDNKMGGKFIRKPIKNKSNKKNQQEVKKLNNLHLKKMLMDMIID